MSDISRLTGLDGTVYDIKDATARSGLSLKQDILSAGSNIKTINGETLLGSGNLEIGGRNCKPVTYVKIYSTLDAYNAGSYSLVAVPSTVGFYFVSIAYSISDAYIIESPDVLEIGQNLNRLIDVRVSGGFIFENLQIIQDASSTSNVIPQRSISIFYAPNCIYVGSNAFSHNQGIGSLNLQNCFMIGSSAFRSARSCDYTFPNCVYLGNYAFHYASGSKLVFPKLKSTWGVSDAFIYCNVVSLYLDELQTLSGFGTGSFSYIYAPKVTYIGYRGLRDCYNLQEANFPLCSFVGSEGFGSCRSLQTVSLPACTSLSNNVFSGCSALKTVYLPNCEFMYSGSCFYSCTLLSDITIPKLTGVVSYCFANCSSLSSITLSNVQTIYAAAFSNCCRLVTLDLKDVGSVPTLASTNVFYSTPIAGFTIIAGKAGSVIVPKSLYDSFRTATNWANISSRIVSA